MLVVLLRDIAKSYEIEVIDKIFIIISWSFKMNINNNINVKTNFENTFL